MLDALDWRRLRRRPGQGSTSSCRLLAELSEARSAFVVVAFFVVKFAFLEIEKDRSQRHDPGNTSRRRKQTKAEAEKLPSEYKKQLADARSEANRIIEEARQQAEQVRKDIDRQGREGRRGRASRGPRSRSRPSTAGHHVGAPDHDRGAVDRARREGRGSHHRCVKRKRDLVDAYIARSRA